LHFSKEETSTIKVKWSLAKARS